MKRILLGAAGLALAIGISQIGMVQTASASDVSQQIAIGQTVNPVTLNMHGLDSNSVYLGSYIVNVTAGCNGCHSNNEYAAGGNPFDGQPTVVNTTCYLNGGQAFGPFISRNITPKSGTTLPAGLTLARFAHVLRTGEDPEHPGTLLQVMPWDTFRYMTDMDIRAVYDYLSSIPSLPTGGSSPC
jgi:hypothetical protein